MQKTLLYQGDALSYRVEGNGKAVVLIHGFGEDSSIFDQQVDFLKDHYLLIVPDVPGSGKSALLQPPTQQSASITIDDYAHCIHAILIQENITSCIMLGHSMGGYITLAFAELYPKALVAFGLINSTAFADTQEKKDNRKRGIELIGKYGAYAFLKNTIPNLFGKQFKENYPEKIDSLIEAGKQFSAAACQQYYTAMMNRPDRTNLLRNNPLPILFVIGTEDVAVPLNDILQQTHLTACAYIHIFENTGHMSMWEATAALNIQLLNFSQLINKSN